MGWGGAGSWLHGVKVAPMFFVESRITLASPVREEMQTASAHGCVACPRATPPGLRADVSVSNWK